MSNLQGLLTILQMLEQYQWDASIVEDNWQDVERSMAESLLELEQQAGVSKVGDQLLKSLLSRCHHPYQPADLQCAVQLLKLRQVSAWIGVGPTPFGELNWIDSRLQEDEVEWPQLQASLGAFLSQLDRYHSQEIDNHELLGWRVQLWDYLQELEQALAQRSLELVQEICQNLGEFIPFLASDEVARLNQFALECGPFAIPDYNRLWNCWSLGRSTQAQILAEDHLEEITAVAQGFELWSQSQAEGPGILRVRQSLERLLQWQQNFKFDPQALQQAQASLELWDFEHSSLLQLLADLGLSKDECLVLV